MFNSPDFGRCCGFLSCWAAIQPKKEPKLALFKLTHNLADHMPDSLMDIGVVGHFRNQLRSEFRKHWGARRFPTRLNRYLIASSYLLAEAQRQSRPLRVCEIGVGRGLMPQLCRASIDYFGLDAEQILDRWTGLDLDTSHVRGDTKYDALYERNIEHDEIPGQHEAYVLLHVVEHLYQPERSLARLVESAPSGAIFVIGVPSHPNLVVGLRESQIRRHTNENGHVSAFSRTRMLRLLGKLGLAVQDERAAYLLRASGYICEDSRWWQTLNFWLGKQLPGMPGEYYVCGRKV